MSDEPKPIPCAGCYYLRKDNKCLGPLNSFTRALLATLKEQP